MADEAALLAQALAEMRKAQISVDEFMLKARDPGYRWRTMHVGKALLALERAAKTKPPVPVPPPPPVPPPAGSVFGGIGVLTAWDNHAAIGLKADWVAIQLDPEGGGGESVASLKKNGGFKYVFGWQARADLAGVQKARTLGLDGYIGQAESEPELQACLELGVLVGLPQAIVGNVTGWSATGQVAALKQRWDLLLEWYQVEQPQLSFDKLDSRGYPVTSFVPGIYHDYTLRSALDQMPAGTSFAPYLAETMSTADRAVFNAR